MQGTDAQIKKDQEELYRYRLSMDQQLTAPNPKVIAFVDKYKDWYQIRQQSLSQVNHAKTR